MNLIDLVQTPLRRVSTNQGGEFHGPCPVCGGNDRFHVWPQQREHGSFWCRGCGIGGDCITFLRKVEGMTFKEACSLLNIEPDTQPKIAIITPPATFEPREASPAINEQWQDKACKLVNFAHNALMGDPVTIACMANRGINPEAIVRHHLGLLKQDYYRDRPSWGLPGELKDNGKMKKLWLPAGVVIPCVDDAGIVQRLRIRRPEGDPRYFVVPGSSTCTWYSQSISPHPTATIVVESELDGIACASAVDNMNVIALGNSSSRTDHASHHLLETSRLILAAMDYDDAGRHGSENLRKWYGDKVKRWPPPVGKDPGEYARQGGSIATWIKAALN